MQYKTRKAITSIISTVVAVVCILTVYFFGIGSNKYKPIAIVSGSMEPTIMTNALILVQYCDFEDVQVGDIITFYAPALQDYNTHRVLEIGDGWFKTQGDNNKQADRELVYPEHLVGKVVHIMNGSAPLLSHFIKDGRYDKASAVATVLGVGIALCFLTLFLSVSLKWAAGAIKVAGGRAFTPKFYDELTVDAYDSQYFLDKVPTSFVRRLRLYMVLKLYHREMEEIKDIVRWCKK